MAFPLSALKAFLFLFFLSYHTQEFNYNHYNKILAFICIQPNANQDSVKKKLPLAIVIGIWYNSNRPNEIGTFGYLGL